MDNIYFIPTNDKPIKIAYDNQDDINVKIENYNLSLYEVLKNELRWNWELRRGLTKQQIHTERGKLRRGLYNEVINFLVKRGVTKEYINSEVDQERQRIILVKTLNMSMEYLENVKFGIIKIRI